MPPAVPTASYLASASSGCRSAPESRRPCSIQTIPKPWESNIETIQKACSSSVNRLLMPLIASSCFDCLSADPVKRIGLYPKSRRRRAIEAAELELRPVTRVTGRSLLRELLHLRTLGQSQREIEMLAEIFLLHLEATARGGKGSASVR